jgi:hypothetical protein
MLPAAIPIPLAVARVVAIVPTITVPGVVAATMRVTVVSVPITMPHGYDHATTQEGRQECKDESALHIQSSVRVNEFDRTQSKTLSWWM